MAKTKRTKIVRVPGTTNNITKGIINYLASKGHFAFRVNNTGIYDEAKGIFRKTGNAGVADIICCIKTSITEGAYEYTAGEFLAIEVKNAVTRDRMSAAQKEFRDCVDFANGNYYIARGYEEFVKWFESEYLPR